jgi:hypothetical protein
VWKVFLFGDEDIRRAVRYVEDNPLKEGLTGQDWSFLVKYPDDVPKRAPAPRKRGR